MTFELLEIVRKKLEKEKNVLLRNNCLYGFT